MTDTEKYRIYSTGEAAEIIGRSRQHCKRLAGLNDIHPLRIGTRGDWMWNSEQVEAVKRLVERGVSK